MNEDRAREDFEKDSQIADARAVIAFLLGLPGGLALIVWWLFAR